MQVNKSDKVTSGSTGGSEQQPSNQHFVHVCPLHRYMINMFCKIHQLVFCEVCGNDHINQDKLFQQNESSQGPQHELEKIEKVVADAESRMQTYLDSFEPFIDKKKLAIVKGAQSQIQFAKEDNIFEEAYNSMADILQKFKVQNNMEKVFSIKDIQPDFIHQYEKAKAAMELINKLISDPQTQQREGSGRDQQPYNPGQNYGYGQAVIDPMIGMQVLPPPVAHPGPMGQMVPGGEDAGGNFGNFDIDKNNPLRHLGGENGADIKMGDDPNAKGLGEKKKRWGVIVQVRAPELQDPIPFEINFSMKLRKFKAQIYSKIKELSASKEEGAKEDVKMEEGHAGGEKREDPRKPEDENDEQLKREQEQKKIDAMRLQVEGGDQLKGNKNLEDYNIPDGCFLLLDYEDGRSKDRRQRNPNVVRQIKEEQKLKVEYAIRGTEGPIKGQVDTLKYFKVKALKKTILLAIGMEGQAELKIYVQRSRLDEEESEPVENHAEEKFEQEEEKNQGMINLEEEKEEEEKKEEVKVEEKVKDPWKELKDSIAMKELLQDGESRLPVEVEVIFKISIEVHGKGKDYSGTFEFQPHETLEAVRSRVPFFKNFAKRGYELVEMDNDRFLPNLKQTFKELDLKSGSKLVLREPGRVKRQQFKQEQINLKMSMDNDANSEAPNLKSQSMKSHEQSHASQAQDEEAAEEEEDPKESEKQEEDAQEEENQDQQEDNEGDQGKDSSKKGSEKSPKAKSGRGRGRPPKRKRGGKK